MTTMELSQNEDYNALIPGLEDIYSQVVDTEETHNPFREARKKQVVEDVQLLLAGLEPLQVEWSVSIREDRQVVKVKMTDLNALLGRLDLPAMPDYIERLGWGLNVTTARCLAALRAALKHSGAPNWCAEVFSENIFGQPWVACEIRPVPDDSQPYGFRNEEEPHFYIPGPTDLLAQVEDGCPYCTVYRARVETRPHLPYIASVDRTVVAVAHSAIEKLLRRPGATGATVVAEARDGRVYYTAESIHETRDVLHALRHTDAPPLPNAACLRRGTYTYYLNSPGRAGRIRQQWRRT